MNRKEAMRQTMQQDTLRSLGFTRDEPESLRRISMTLHRWYEHECNGEIERDEKTGETFGTNAGSCVLKPIRWRVPDRERGAEKRLKAIIDARNTRVFRDKMKDADSLAYYLQTDPRGAVLYIIRPGDVPEGKDVGAYYTRGICVY